MVGRVISLKAGFASKSLRGKVGFASKSLRRKIVFIIVGTLSIALALFAYYDVQEQRQAEEQAQMAKGRILAITGAQAIGSILEEAVASGQLTHQQIFDTSYQPIPDTKPQKYHTAYDSFTDRAIQDVEDRFFSDPDVAFAVAVDRNGYLPTHNSKFSTKASDPELNRTKRIFNDNVGLAVARNTEEFLQQIYYRDTGEVMYDFSAPIMVQGEHWGGFRVGFLINRVEAHLADVTRRIALSVLAVILALGVMAILIANRITSPIAKAARAARQIAEVDLANLEAGLAAAARGDLNGELKVESRVLEIGGSDEIGQMGQSFNLMMARLKAAQDAYAGMVSGLRELVSGVVASAASVAESSRHLARATDEAGVAAGQVADAIEQVAAGASQQARDIADTNASAGQLTRIVDRISHGVQEQTGQVERANQAVDRIESAITEVSSNVGRVAAAAEHAQRVAAEGVGVVDDSIQGMAAIKETVINSSTKVLELGGLSKQIGQIVETIGDIADQTNLLALNAAIEAARAGEHGRGFAVVAGEVRKLAERSSVATKEIGNLLSNIQKGTDEAVAVMNEGTVRVERGSELAAEAGRSLQEIVQAVKATRLQFEHINAAVERVSGLSQEMVQTMESVSSVVCQYSVATEEMALNASGIIRSMDGVARVSEGNSATAQQVSASVEEMSSQIQEIATTAQSLDVRAKELQEAIASFSIGQDGNVGIVQYQPRAERVRRLEPVHGRVP